MASIINVKDVSMEFKMSREKVDSIKEYVIRFFSGNLKYDIFTALNNVSFSIEEGEVVGLVGLNGSGKSTMLKIISGILKPTKGSVEVNGNISPLIELGAGFDFDLTAEENVYLNGSVLGYSKREMEKKLPEIIEFSELQDFMNVPIKNFSSGMIARLGFSIATITRPEILIVDEILSVGDFKFHKKCEERISEMMSGGTTVLMVSLSLVLIKRLCDKVIWLSHGNVIMEGRTEEVCQAYENQEE